MNVTIIKYKNIEAYVSGTQWSYVVNGNGNGMRITLYGYGSCVPLLILKEWIETLPREEIDRLSDECDKIKDEID